MAVDHNNPQSRDEEILIATIDGKEYNKNPQSRMEELLLELKETIEEGGGGGGTTNYENLSNQPQVNGETLIGDKSGSDLGLVDAEEGKGLSTNDYDDTEKAAVAAATSAISAIKDGVNIDSFGDVETALSAIKDGSEIDSFGDVEVALLDKADTSDLGTAAAKDSTNSVTSGSTDLVESGAVKDAIDAAVSSAYHHAGTKTVAQLTHDLLIAANEGNVYNITDSGTTTSDFIEGIGKTIDEGSNVGICKVGDVYMFDLLSGFVDTTNFVQKSQTSGLLKNDGTVNTTIESTVAGHTAAIATKQPITDNTLQTTDKTIPGAINEVKSGLTNLSEEVNGDATTYPYADVITIPDAVPANVADCSVKIEPVQDLHGYDHPWVGGAGKNKIPLTVSGIKSFNTSGTWTGNVYSVNGVTLELLTDSDNNATGVKLNGSNNSGTGFDLIFYYGNMSDMVSIGGTYTVTDCTVTDGRTHEYSGTFTIDSDWYINAGFIKIWVGATTTYDNEIRHPQLEVGNQATTFAPYTNICPISGHTEASVQRARPNMLDGLEQGFYSSNGVKVDDNKQVRSSDYIDVVGSASYVISTDTTGLNVYVSQYSGKDTTRIIGSNWQSLPYNFTTESNAKYIHIMFKKANNNDLSPLEVVNPRCDTLSAYEEIQTYTIALGDTIYGGTVDFDSGVMTVDMAIKDLGDLTWTLEPTQDANKKRLYCSDLSPAAKSVRAEIISDAICSCYGTVTFGQTFRCYTGIGVSGTYVVAYDANYTDATVFTTDMTGQKICYELATPTTIQLTPQQIQLLKGTNTLTASTGQISVTANGVSGSIGSVQTQANNTDEALAGLAADIAEQLPTAPTTDGAYVLTVTVADGTPTYSWVSGS